MMVSIWSKQQDMFETSWEAWPAWTELMSYTKYHLESFQAYQRAGSELCLLQAVPFPYRISLSGLSLTPAQIGNWAPCLRCCTGTSPLSMGEWGHLHGSRRPQCLSQRAVNQAWLWLAPQCSLVGPHLGDSLWTTDSPYGHVMHSNNCFSKKAGLTFNWCKYGFQIPSRRSCRYFLVKYPR